MDTKSERLSFRITKDTSNKIEHMIRQGKFASRSDFGLQAVNTLIDLQDNHTHYLRVIVEYIFHSSVSLQNTRYDIPPPITQAFRELYRELLDTDDMAG